MTLKLKREPNESFKAYLKRHTSLITRAIADWPNLNAECLALIMKIFKRDTRTSSVQKYFSNGEVNVELMQSETLLKVIEYISAQEEMYTENSSAATPATSRRTASSQKIYNVQTSNNTKAPSGRYTSPSKRPRYTGESTSSSQGPYCKHHRSYGHYTRDCRNPPQGVKYCSYHRSRGHSTSECTARPAQRNSKYCTTHQTSSHDDSECRGSSSRSAHSSSRARVDRRQGANGRGSSAPSSRDSPRRSHNSRRPTHRSRVQARQAQINRLDNENSDFEYHDRESASHNRSPSRQQQGNEGSQPSRLGTISAAFNP